MNATVEVCKLRSASVSRRQVPRSQRHGFAAAALAAALAGCGGAPSAPAFADTARGARLAAQYQCGSCHTNPGVAGAMGKVAVSLESVGRRSFIAGRIPNRDPALARWIADPAALVPDTTMPDMGVSDADARDIAAYLRALR